MDVVDLAISGVKRITPRVFPDDCGYFQSASKAGLSADDLYGRGSGPICRMVQGGVES
jgi:hypothetical protein